MNVVVGDVYEWGKFLGEGTTSSVYRARLKSAHKDGPDAQRLKGRLGYDANDIEITKVAIKCVDRFAITAEDTENVKSEV